MSEKEKSEKLFIHAFREVRTYILKNQLKQGDILPSEAQLCQEIGVSRNVLREAIKSMELMGMVRACPGRGTEVMEFNMDFFLQNIMLFNMAGDDEHIRQMFQIRKTLELGFMRQAFDSIRPEQIRRMRELTEQMRISWEESGAFASEDRSFHMTLFSSVGNPVLNSLLNAIWEIDKGYQLEEKLPHLASSVSKHEAIVKGLEDYDYISFARAMDLHYTSGKYSPERKDYEEY